MRLDRIQDCITALQTSPNPEKFTMGSWGGPGCPQCVAGHYFEFKKYELGGVRALCNMSLYSPTRIWMALCEHFEVDEITAMDLFGFHGCGNAQTIEEAIEYLEHFLAYHLGHPAQVVHLNHARLRRVKAEAATYKAAQRRQGWVTRVVIEEAA